MLEARVKKSSDSNIITALGGMTFTKQEWLPIPADEQLEKEAKENPFLDVRKIGGSVSAPVESEPAPPETVDEVIELLEEDEAEYSASPSAVELSNELGIDLALVEGTGAGGNIIKSDVVAYAESLSEEED